MEPDIRIIPAGRRPYWRADGNTLIIWLNEDLDEFSRRRYIKQAEDEQVNSRSRQRRRRTLLPLVATEGARHAAGPHHHTAAAIAGTVAAAGIAATAVAPFILDHTPMINGERQVVNAAPNPPVAGAPAPGDPRPAPAPDAAAHSSAAPRNPRHQPSSALLTVEQRSPIPSLPARITLHGRRGTQRLDVAEGVVRNHVLDRIHAPVSQSSHLPILLSVGSHHGELHLQASVPAPTTPLR